MKKKDPDSKLCSLLFLLKYLKFEKIKYPNKFKSKFKFKQTFI